MPTLTDLGFTGLATGTDLTRMTGDDRDLALTGVYHQAFVAVNEAGTEAAAGTVMGTSAGGFVNANPPFLFAIQDDLTGAILFVGRVTDPS